MTNEELDYLFDLLRDKRRGFERLLKPNHYRGYSYECKKQFRKDLKLVKSIEEKLLHISPED